MHTALDWFEGRFAALRKKVVIVNLYTFIVPADVSPTRLLPLVKRMLPELPEYAIRETFEKRDVKMDGVRAGKDDTAKAGARVQLYTRYAGNAKEVPILYEDEYLVIVRKPIGVSCEADARGGKTIAELSFEALRKKNPSAKPPLPCHRLDNQTDGLLLLAKDENTQSELMAAFKHRQIHKVYCCLVQGAPKESHGLLTAYLIKDAALGRVTVVPEKRRGAARILTEYEVMERGGVSRLRVTLHTGRTHQIRAQMAAIGHPLLGDDVYGNRAFNREHRAKRLMLCATELSFSLTGSLQYMNGKSFSIEPLF